MWTKALVAHDGDIVGPLVDGEFTIKYLNMEHKEDGYIELVPQMTSMRRYASMQPIILIWGVVAWTIKAQGEIFQ